jgi:Domain of unknown function (DU1801)
MTRATGATAPTTIDEYIEVSPLEVQPILSKIRKTIGAAAPEAEELISYRMPAFRLRGILIYFAAFKAHIGLYPPVSGDASLEKLFCRLPGRRAISKSRSTNPSPTISSSASHSSERSRTSLGRRRRGRSDRRSGRFQAAAEYARPRTGTAHSRRCLTAD